MVSEVDHKFGKCIYSFRQSFLSIKSYHFFTMGVNFYFPRLLEVGLSPSLAPLVGLTPRGSSSKLFHKILVDPLRLLLRLRLFRSFILKFVRLKI